MQSLSECIHHDFMSGGLNCDIDTVVVDATTHKQGALKEGTGCTDYN